MSEKTPVHDILRQIDFFRDFTRDEIDELLHIGQWIKFSAGHSIIADGSTGREIFILVRGQVKVVKNGVNLAVLNPGDCFGEISALADTPRNAHVISRSECFAVKLEAMLINRLNTELQLKLVKKLLFVLADRLTNLNRRFTVT